MKNSFEIKINIMGDPDDKIAIIDEVSENGEYRIMMPNGVDKIALKKLNNNWVQTYGTPLDSNTIHSFAEALNKRGEI